MISIIRHLLTGWLCFMIYKETGPFTGFGFFLIFLTLEFISVYMRNATRLTGLMIKKAFLQGEKI